MACLFLHIATARWTGSRCWPSARRDGTPTTASGTTNGKRAAPARPSWALTPAAGRWSRRARSTGRTAFAATTRWSSGLPVTCSTGWRSDRPLDRHDDGTCRSRRQGIVRPSTIESEPNMSTLAPAPVKIGPDTQSPAASRARPATPPASDRLVSLDAYRGLIMLTLLAGGVFHSLKDHPTWHWLYVQNEHVAWEGFVYWALIQPSFMFMVGVAMSFALAKRAVLGESWGRRFLHVLIRAFNLVLVGVLLDNFGSQTWSIGFMRVLQQIAFGYVVAFFVVGRSFRTQA